MCDIKVCVCFATRVAFINLKAYRAPENVDLCGKRDKVIENKELEQFVPRTFLLARRRQMSASQ